MFSCKSETSSVDFLMYNQTILFLEKHSSKTRYHYKKKKILLICLKISWNLWWGDSLN